MKFEARTLVAPLAAVIILALILTQTREALTLSGAWRRPRPDRRAVTPDPYASLDHLLAGDPAPRAGALRDPFNAVVSQVVTIERPRKPAPPRKPVPPPQPVLTSIIFDADPRATLRWSGRDYSVRAGALFADFRVVSIARDQVVLDRGGESLVLRMPRKGETP